MTSIETLTSFFGWCTVINIGFIIIVLLIAGLFHEGIGEIHAKIFGVSKEEAKATFFRTYLQYRFTVAVFCLVPYIALKIIMS